MNDLRPFEEYKEMIKDMRKEEMIKGLYDLSARVTKQENIIKEVREYIENTTYADITGLETHSIKEFWFVKELLEILERWK